MNQENTYTKESIRNRFYNHAANFWGVSNVDDLDPLVKMLLEALANEIYEVNNTIEDINVRILENLASVLTPSVLISPHPAHSVMQAFPLESHLFLDTHTTFIDKRLPQDMRRQGLDVLSFVPVNNVRLVSGKIKYMVCERMLFRVEENGLKTSLTTAHTINEKINHTLWIALDVHQEVKTLKDISFYIDFPNSANKHEKYSLLSYCKWSIANKALEMSAGLPLWDDEHTKTDPCDRFLFEKYNLLNQIDENISELYRMQFHTVDADVMLQDIHREAFPEEIKGIFHEHITQTMEPCCWIKVTFPPHILAADIHNITVALNAFPVANKILHSKICPSNNMTGIIPLRVERWESFLSMDKVDDSHGYEYRPLPYTSELNTRIGFYSIKQGGIERFDKRDVKEYIERLIDLLRSETAAFTAMDLDNMRNVITTLKKGLTDIEIKYSNSKMEGLEISHYLLLNTINKNDSVFLNYWSTNCEQANGLTSGKTLVPLSSLPLAKDSCRLLKITSGGKLAPNVTGKMDAFRYVLTSRDQIMTNADIVNFCTCEMAEKITCVEVKKGITVSSKPKEGLIRTIDVHLTPTPGYKDIVGEMQSELLIKLYGKSPDSFNYRIIIN